MGMMKLGSMMEHDTSRPASARPNQSLNPLNALSPLNPLNPKSKPLTCNPWQVKVKCRSTSHLILRSGTLPLALHSLKGVGFGF